MDETSIKSDLSDLKDEGNRRSDLVDENARLRAECAYLKEITSKIESGYAQEMHRFKSLLIFQSEATDILRLENERLDTKLNEQSKKLHDLYTNKVSLEQKVSNLSGVLKEKDAKLKEAEHLVE